MQYMFLIYLDETKFAPMTQKERDSFTNRMLDYDDELRASGHYVVSEALKMPDEAVTVRAWDGTLATTDGPFMETKEHLSGFFLVEARDLNEAIQLAGRMPLARVGSVEVRPVDTLERIPE
ncbi:YciI family protein [Pelagibacterium xiamenense]|uniref:YciI family protein n=1 Tax=Pelagibacterium xiamenense TaxID=2901140 RepID=UPI001E302C1F|nr:YciI family protein [Pelagibacterium xiamenense]MCD7060013.1 YciI family protein [Pelagibacterium xiamenense]